MSTSSVSRKSSERPDGVDHVLLSVYGPAGGVTATVALSVEQAIRLAGVLQDAVRKL